MARRPRLDGDGAVHHVMNRGVNHQRIFFGEADRIEFVERLTDLHRRFGVETLAYALMTNHYHLLLRTPSGGLSSAMHRLGLVYVKRTNERVGRDGPLFRARFHSIRVTTDAYLAYATRYVHRNPLDLPAVERPEEYRWSSDWMYRSDRAAPPFLNTSPVLSLFGHDRHALARFVDGDGVVGTPRSAATAEDVRQLIQLGIGVRELTSKVDGCLPSWFERTAMLLVADAIPDTQLGDDIVRSLEFPTRDAEQVFRRRALARARHPLLSGLVAEVASVAQRQRRAA